MDVEEHRDLRLLEAVHQNSRVTQRGLAGKLGIALGLANIYLKRMVHKGFIKVVNVQPNRISYLVTPRGIAEKARLTYEFMDYSLHLYGDRVVAYRMPAERSISIDDLADWSEAERALSSRHP